MSLNLYWEPMHRDKESLPDELKYALRKRHGGTVNMNYSEHDIPYLEGLRDAGVKGADELIQAILQYKWVSLSEEG